MEKQNETIEIVFKDVKEASDYLYGVDDGQVDVGEFKQVRIIFEQV